MLTFAIIITYINLEYGFEKFILSILNVCDTSVLFNACSLIQLKK